LKEALVELTGVERVTNVVVCLWDHVSLSWDCTYCELAVHWWTWGGTCYFREWAKERCHYGVLEHDYDHTTWQQLGDMN
jgi:hypothetical protein